MFKLSGLGDGEINQPIKPKTLKDINHPITKHILYLYSMEIGSPQLYADVNRVSRDKDLTYLKELGPFIKVLGRITMIAE